MQKNFFSRSVLRFCSVALNFYVISSFFTLGSLRKLREAAGSQLKKYQTQRGGKLGANQMSFN